MHIISIDLPESGILTVGNQKGTGGESCHIYIMLQQRTKPGAAETCASEGSAECAVDGASDLLPPASGAPANSATLALSATSSAAFN